MEGSYVSDFDESIVIDTEQRSLTAIHKSHSVETLGLSEWFFYSNSFQVVNEGGTFWTKNKNVKLTC